MTHLTDQEMALVSRIAALGLRAQNMETWEEMREFAREIISLADEAEKINFSLSILGSIRRHGMTGNYVHQGRE